MQNALRPLPITEDRVKMILSWRHTGFHVPNEGKVVANDAEGRERLARYLIRPPVSHKY